MLNFFQFFYAGPKNPFSGCWPAILHLARSRIAQETINLGLEINLQEICPQYLARSSIPGTSRDSES